MSKKNRRALRRTLLSLSMMLVVAFAAVSGTIAWLTAETKVVTNTFSVGDVKIDLDEADVNEYGELEYKTKDNPDTEADESVLADRVTENAYKLLPGHTYTKDPIVYVKTKSEPCYVFVKVENGLSAIEADTKIATQMTANGWTQLVVDGADVPNVYYYNTVVDARNAAADVQLKVFESFTIINTIKNEELPAYKDAKITIDAYAVQQDTFDSAAAAWKAAPTSWTETTTPPADGEETTGDESTQG